MPELPEVETIATGLRRAVAGLAIDRIRLHRASVLREGPAVRLGDFRRRRVLDVRRRGKMLLLVCSDGLSLLFHLKMTGQFIWAERNAPPDRHTALSIRFRDTGRELRFRDVRTFGFLRCLESPRPESCPELGALGPEPLDIGLDGFAARLARRTGRLKSLLLQQTFVAGIGNIYADEILFAARLHPLTRADSLSAGNIERLWTAMRTILARAIAAGGSSIRDYKNAEGMDGHFQFEHKAYGRAGRPCPRCGRSIVRTVIGGRASFFCPRCQRRKPRRNR